VLLINQRLCQHDHWNEQLSGVVAELLRKARLSGLPPPDGTTTGTPNEESACLPQSQRT